MMEHKIFSFKIKQGNGSKYAEVWNECQGEKRDGLRISA